MIVNDPRSGGLPSGQPPLNAFLGLPFFHGETLVGVIGIANRPGGYSEADVTYLDRVVRTKDGWRIAIARRAPRGYGQPHHLGGEPHPKTPVSRIGTRPARCEARPVSSIQT